MPSSTPLSAREALTIIIAAAIIAAAGTCALMLWAGLSWPWVAGMTIFAALVVAVHVACVCVALETAVEWGVPFWVALPALACIPSLAPLITLYTMLTWTPPEPLDSSVC